MTYLLRVSALDKTKQTIYERRRKEQLTSLYYSLVQSSYDYAYAYTLEYCSRTCSGSGSGSGSGSDSDSDSDSDSWSCFKYKTMGLGSDRSYDSGKHYNSSSCYHQILSLVGIDITVYIYIYVFVSS